MLLGALLKKNKHFEVAGEKYTEEEQIGEGAFAYVYKVKDKHGNHFAMKKMICQTDEQLAEARKEINILSGVSHRNILSLHGHSIDLNKAGQHEVYLLLPLYAKSLQDVIDSGPGYPCSVVPSPRVAVTVLMGCVDAVEALHARGFRHGDLKPANILLNDDWFPVLTDFGSVEPLSVEVTSRGHALSIQENAASNTTASFRSPELFDTPSSGAIDGKADVWGIGCLAFALLFSRTPFESPVDGLSTLAVLSGNFSFPASSRWAPEFHTMIQACLRVDLQARLSVHDLKLVVSLLPQSDSFQTMTLAGVSFVETGCREGGESSTAFADFAQFPPTNPQTGVGKRTEKKQSSAHTGSGKATNTSSTKEIVAAAPTAGSAVAETNGILSRDCDWQAGGPTGDEMEPLHDDLDDDFEFGDFVAATGDAGAGAGGGATNTTPSKRNEGDLNSSVLSSESSFSSPEGCISRVELPVASKSGFVFVIRPRRTGLGKSCVKKKVWLGMNGRRIFIQKTADPKSKVHMYALLGLSSSMRITHSIELAPHSAVLEGLCDYSANMYRGDKQGGGNVDDAFMLSREFDINLSNSHPTGGNSLSVEIGFETRADLESWLAAVQNQVDALQ